MNLTPKRFGWGPHSSFTLGIGAAVEPAFSDGPAHLLVSVLLFHFRLPIPYT